MAFEVTFELTESDLDYFRDVMRKAQAGAKKLSDQEILANAEQLSQKVKDNVPTFVSERIQKLEIFERSGIWQGSFEELRCCLFYEQRRWRHFGTGPTGDQLMGLQALFLAVSERWDIEAGGAGV